MEILVSIWYIFLEKVVSIWSLLETFFCRDQLSHHCLWVHQHENVYRVGGETRPCPFPVTGNGHGRVTEPKVDQFFSVNDSVPQPPVTDLCFELQLRTSSSVIYYNTQGEAYIAGGNHNWILLNWKLLNGSSLRNIAEKFCSLTTRFFRQKNIFVRNAF